MNAARGADGAPRRPLRIEMVLPSLAIGGMESMTAALVRGLARRGHAVGVTCIETLGELAGPLCDEGIPVSLVPTPGVRTIVHAPALAAHFRRRAPDVVHTHNGAWEKGARAARHAGVAQVGFTFHGFLGRLPWYSRYGLRLVARDTDWVAAVSDELRAYTVGEIGVPAGKVHHLINGIDTDRFAPAPASGALHAELGLAPGTPLVGTVARMDPVKNHRLLLDAFAAVVADGAAAHLVLVGDGPLFDEVAARAAAPDLAGRVHLLGARGGLDALYREFHVFALASTTEGTSMSILEAMASARCVVATAVGGTPALLADGACGLLVPSGDAPALARALRRAVDDPALRATLGAAARARAGATYSQHAMLDRYESLFAAHAAPARATVPAPDLACAG
jgi:glycosyltransferase involved in cell wall biosynthesis